jgi:CRP/FNR family cyclic AMP-dependent transcriptional regulator
MTETSQDTRSILEGLPIFQGLTATELDWVARHSHRNTFPTGTRVLVSEQPGEAMYVILAGTVKVYIEQKKPVLLSIIGEGDMLGEISLLDSSGHSASAVTLEDSLLLWINKAAFYEMLDTMPRIARNMVQMMATRLRMNNDLIQALAILDTYGRVARQILAFADRYDPNELNEKVLIPITVTQADMSDLVGASRRRVNQAMGYFKEQGYITVNPAGKMLVLNRAGLRRYCQ